MWTFGWIIAAIVLFIVEVISINTITICFVPGAIVAAILAGIGLPAWLQFIAFVIVSGLMLGLFRRYYVNKIKSKAKALPDPNKIEGKIAIVSQDIAPGEIGQIKLDGNFWSATSIDEDKSIPSGTKVMICRRDGAKCVVEKYEDLGL